MSARRGAASPPRGATVVGASVLLALIMLLGCIYTAAQVSRDIATAATELQRIDAVRARVSELESAHLLGESGDPDLARLADELSARASGALADAAGSATLDGDVQAALDAYITSRAGQARTATADDHVTRSADPATELVDLLMAARRDVERDLADARATLDGLSGLLAVLVTYIVPALAYLVFWLSVRQTRQLREVQAQARVLHQRASLRDALFEARLEAVIAAASDAADASLAGTPSLRVQASVAETRAMLETLDERSHAVPQMLTSDDIHRLVELEHRSSGGDHVTFAGEEVRRAAVRAWVDPTTLRRALSLILANARHRGSRNVRVAYGQDHGNLTIAIRHDGRPLNDAETRLVLDQVPLADDGAIERGSDLLLPAYASRLLEHTGASLDVHRAEGRETITVTIAGIPRTVTTNPAADHTNPAIGSHQDATTAAAS